MTLKIENFKLKINKACSTPVEKIYKIKYSQKEYFINLGCPTGVEPVLSVPQTDVITVIPRTPPKRLIPIDYLVTPLVMSCDMTCQ